MFFYRPPKGSCWGHAIHPGNTLKAIQKMHTFFEAYFEPIVAEKLTLNLNPRDDKDHHVPRLKEKAVQIFGRPGHPDSLDWTLPPGDYLRVINFILENHPSPKKPGDPIWLSFTCALKWKPSALPTLDWPEEFLKPGNEKSQESPLFTVNLRTGGRFMFILGLLIPVLPKAPSTYEFLGGFSADAPFKMSAKHFQVIIPIGKKGKLATRKPDADVLAKLNEVIK